MAIFGDEREWFYELVSKRTTFRVSLAEYAKTPDGYTMSVFSVVDKGAASLFGTASSIRRKRIFHPRGKAYYGTLQLTAPEDTLPACHLFSHRGPLSVITRISRGVGFPAPWPDVLGIALRITNMYGPQQHQDFLFCSSGKNPVARRLFIPATTYFARSYCTVLSYRIAGQPWLLSMVPKEPIFILAIASPTGSWRKIGELSLGQELPAQETEQLRFNPWNTGTDIYPAGFLQRLRKNSYRASQAARAKFR